MQGLDGIAVARTLLWTACGMVAGYIGLGLAAERLSRRGIAPMHVGGAGMAMFIGLQAWMLLRLPHEVAPLFVEWLREHYPDRAEHVLSLLRQLRGGELYDAQFGSRQRGFGPFAALLQARFAKARSRFGLDHDLNLRRDKFLAPRPSRPQLDLGF